MSANTYTVGPLQLSIGSSTFTASLLDNPTVSTFCSMLPLDLQMTELNGNEKYADLSTTLPTGATSPGSIKAGDLMLYGSRTLVLWYENCSTSYAYTRIASIENAEGLSAALGAGDVSVRFAANGGSGSTGGSAAINSSACSIAGPSSNRAGRGSAHSYSKKT